MYLFEFLVGAAFLAIVAFQAWLTVRVFKSSLFEKKQKIWQAQIIWLLPIIGAGLVFSILQEETRSYEEASAHLKDRPASKS
jgi:TRAP-type C4-dicarboxylate transport system permease small subunit